MTDKKQFTANRISLLLLIVLVMLILLSVLSGTVVNHLTNLHKILIYIVIFIIPISVYIRMNRYKASKVLRLSHVKVKYLPFIILFALSVSIICAIVNMLFSAILSNVWDVRFQTSTVSFTSYNPLVIAITLVIMPAVCEELLMRGIALYEYGKYGVFVSILITSVLFALLHASPATLVSLFIAGVFYAILTYLFKSVYPAIICHIINNALAVYISYNSDYIHYLLSDPIFIVIFVVVLVLILYATLCITENIVDELGDKNRLKTDTKKLAYGDPIASPYIWIFIIVCILFIISKALY